MYVFRRSFGYGYDELTNITLMGHGQNQRKCGLIGIRSIDDVKREKYAEKVA